MTGRRRIHGGMTVPRRGVRRLVLLKTNAGTTGPHRRHARIKTARRHARTRIVRHVPSVRDGIALLKIEDLVHEIVF